MTDGGGPGAVASTLVRHLLAGPPRPAAVVAAGRAATYLDVDGELLAVVAAGGLRLPCALVLTDPWRRPPATGAVVGGGAVRAPGWPEVRVRRWFDPRVRLGAVDPEAVARLADLVAARGAVDPLLPADAVDLLDDSLAAAGLIGRGSGSTPAGDDLVAGALAALRSAGAPAADRLAAAVRAVAGRRTTRLSAALLAAADLGAMVPEARAVLRALAPGARGLDGAVDRLVAVGHTSGWHLAAGLLVGVRHAAAAEAAA
jgi:Protein of unknown function (DUF2877)